MCTVHLTFTENMDDAENNHLKSTLDNAIIRFIPAMNNLVDHLVTFVKLN